MSGKLVLALALIFSFGAEACPKEPPAGFTVFKVTKDAKVFVNADQSATIGLNCTSMPRSESSATLEYFKNRVTLDDRTSYFALNERKDVIAGIYFRVLDHQLIQIAVTAKPTTADTQKNLHKIILDQLANTPK
jgi:hypothetical protein